VAELLVKNAEPPHLNAGNVGQVYRKDDVVVIMPDGHTWGSEELNPAKFRIVKFPGVAVDRFKFLIDVDLDGRDEMILRRRWKIVDSDRSADDKRGVLARRSL
jgi:hypothetical protein